MKGLENVKYYIQANNSTNYIGRIDSVETITEEFYDEDEPYIPIVDGDREFEMHIRLSEVGMLIATGIFQEAAKHCSNKRVVHLADYAKKKRVRYKNIKRVVKIAEKENRNG